MEYFFQKLDLLPNIKDFQIISVDLCSFLSFSKQNKNLLSPKKWEKNWNHFWKKKKSEKFQLYRNWKLNIFGFNKLFWPKQEHFRPKSDSFLIFKIRMIQQNFSLWLLGLPKRHISGKNRNFESFLELLYNLLDQRSDRSVKRTNSPQARQLPFTQWHWYLNPSSKNYDLQF